jgi:aryl-alcohol dehydrogenase-like predicted oxidoreductase
MAKEKGVNPSAIVVAWLTNLYRAEGFPRVIPLFSATSAHLVDNLRGLEVTLTDEELALMNKV